MSIIRFVFPLYVCDSGIDPNICVKVWHVEFHKSSDFVISCMKIKFEAVRLLFHTLQHKLMSRPLYCRHKVESSDGSCSYICLNIQVELWYNQRVLSFISIHICQLHCTSLKGFTGWVTSLDWQFGPVISYFETLEIKDLLRNQIVFANVPFEMIQILTKSDCIWILIPILDTPPWKNIKVIPVSRKRQQFTTLTQKIEDIAAVLNDIWWRLT